ncbi:MAG: hypothetical protein AB1510_02145 [Bacillota bacterium]
MAMAVVKNIGDRKVTLRWAGQDLYELKPGQEMPVPVHLAKHYAGDWDLKDGALKEEEERRVTGLFGGQRVLQVVKQVPDKPKPERKLPKLPGEGGEGEQPFAALAGEE